MDSMSPSATQRGRFVDQPSAVTAVRDLCIHFRFATEQGKALGRKVGRYIVEHHLRRRCRRGGGGALRPALRIRPDPAAVNGRHTAHASRRPFRPQSRSPSYGLYRGLR